MQIQTECISGPSIYDIEFGEEKNSPWQCRERQMQKFGDKVLRNNAVNLELSCNETISVLK